MGRVFYFDAGPPVEGSAAARMLAVAQAGLSMPRTLPRDRESRDALRDVGERAERLGPVSSN